MYLDDAEKSIFKHAEFSMITRNQSHFHTIHVENGRLMSLTSDVNIFDLLANSRKYSFRFLKQI